MTIEEIKQEMAKRNMTQQELASTLGINPKGLCEILRGARPMTEALHNHIYLLFNQPREAVLVYRVNISEKKATELCGEHCSPNPVDRASAIETVIHHNLAELIELGKTCTWSAEEQEFLGITKPPHPTTYSKALDPYA